MAVNPTSPDSSARRRGFTLIELLVVIGIITLLMGILIPMVVVIHGRMAKSAMVMEMQTVAHAIEQYRSDVGKFYSGNGNDGYPIQLTPAPNPPFVPAIGGAQLLGWALLGPGLEVAQGVDAADGYGTLNDRFGFRASKLAGNDGKLQGTRYGPYLSTDKFTYTTPAYELLDSRSQPILYFLAHSVNPTDNPGAVFVGDGSQPCRWDVNENQSAGQPAVSIEQLALKLGIDKTGAWPGSGQSPAYNGAFIVWSAGPDRTFGTKDDVTNIDQ